MAGQTKMGKAFEYACLRTVFNALVKNQKVVVEETAAVNTAKKFYNEVPENEVEKMNLAAKAAMEGIFKLEPQLQHPQDNVPLYLTIQEDARGIAGDVRDVLCIRRQNEWEIGFSCKHNHHAVKHSRLSQRIDFGKQWFGKSCSEAYFEEIGPIFSKLVELKSQKALWNELDNKEKCFYVPLLNAFVTELKRLYEKYSEEIPAALITYLLGRNDFYKIIEQDANRTTEIHAFNIFGTLNQPSGSIKPIAKIPQVKLPSKIFDISFKQDSNNTIIVTCDQGWTVSLRIHNASSKVEPSLKFDVHLTGTPNLGFIRETWE